MDDFTDLYQGRATSRNWLADRTSEQQDWLNQLADHIREAGREPNLSWRELNRRFDSRWPGEAPADATILARYVRSLVAK